MGLYFILLFLINMRLFSLNWWRVGDEGEGFLILPTFVKMENKVGRVMRYDLRWMEKANYRVMGDGLG